MTERVADGSAGIVNILRMVGWTCVALALLIPLVANFPWTRSDFVIAGVVLGGAGLLMELVARTSPNLFHLFGTAAAVAGVVLLLWVNGAVGFFGDEDNPANLMFLGVIAVASLGAVFAGFRSAGMARAMVATAAAQLAVGVTGYAAGWASPGNTGIFEVVMGSAMFLTLWLIAAGLFRAAAQQQVAATPAS